jgi:hypothetical protein
MSINDALIGSEQQKGLWGSESSPFHTRLRVSRSGGDAIEYDVKLVPMRAMLEEAWLRTSPQLYLASVNPHDQRRFIAQLNAPFTTGIRVVRFGREILVDAILAGSPASRQKIETGLEVLSLNGQNSSLLSDAEIAGMLEGYSSQFVAVTVLQHGQARTYRMKLEGLSKILSGYSISLSAPPYIAAALSK